jgi:hypothetical protein
MRARPSANVVVAYLPETQHFQTLQKTLARHNVRESTREKFPSKARFLHHLGQARRSSDVV